jgi:hypothetical protein
MIPVTVLHEAELELWEAVDERRKANLRHAVTRFILHPSALELLPSLIAGKGPDTGRIESERHNPDVETRPDATTLHPGFDDFPRLRRSYLPYR